MPILIIGEKTIVGYYDEQTTGERIKSVINNYVQVGCPDIVAPITNNKIGSQCIHGCDPRHTY